jgi:hypothetical protein
MPKQVLGVGNAGPQPIRIQHNTFDPAEEQKVLSRDNPQFGVVVGCGGPFCPPSVVVIVVVVVVVSETTTMTRRNGREIAVVLR